MPKMFVSVGNVPTELDHDYSCVKKSEHICQIQIKHQPKQLRALYITVVGTVHIPHVLLGFV
jgi:hypothetical protein